jgi:hypothetical protein
VWDRCPLTSPATSCWSGGTADEVTIEIVVEVRYRLVPEGAL